MATKKKKPASSTATITGRRTMPEWFYAYPSDQNRLLEDARALVAAAQVAMKANGITAKDYPNWFKAAGAFMRETKP